METKYYYLCYWTRYGTFEPKFGHAFTTAHPLKWNTNSKNTKGPEVTVVISWREITKEEFDEFKE